MLLVTELRAGKVFEEKGQYYLVLTYEHIKMGRGSGTVKVKVRSLSSGATVEKSFITGAKVAEVNLNRKKVQYLYKDSQGCHLMDIESYEQFAVPVSLISDIGKFLKEGMELTLGVIDDKPVSVEIPKIIEYKITQTGGSARGNTVGATYKDATLENGLTVKVPLFIKTGEVIRVDTRSGEYVERAK
ncbi:elongation factor P [Candidatus Curtissbacteria bacterium RIFCSPHIGHO2_02_FULL_40_17]|uniref:Elongation factor P n=3 Tax=Candidatus Curtissiibacteriota TaxID=1752717 RepID=A0A1F5GKB1_9BACT|nr:MAG: elongation factor P [Candidatus Curtissbacteria bacterium RIFCSPHIGHO2_02_FULL_40_17]OGE03933.1 MAG: elongation factor P [Candidatus Curtissbacteria bacterium RIFCSPHIGHO2_12_FULL_41_17]OGE07052.1 MAG: elongation factor P [Candidatus Curtissbacteria bacterium RIFCSPLOWO2_02_FULL_40_13b]